MGCVKLDRVNPIDSEMLIPARERSQIDWSMVNRLAKENKDFRIYVELIKEFNQTYKLRPQNWDYAPSKNI